MWCQICGKYKGKYSKHLCNPEDMTSKDSRIDEIRELPIKESKHGLTAVQRRILASFWAIVRSKLTEKDLETIFIAEKMKPKSTRQRRLFDE